MLYPFKFEPILKKIIWGGNQICRFKGIQPEQNGIGESWEISHVKDKVSIVSEGDLKGKSLEELIESDGEKLLGKQVIERFGTTFPLLIKFIDARDALSVQVHPDDELARKRHNSFGKTEMWYVVKAEKDAFLYSGFAQEMTPEQYVKSLTDGSFIHYLQKYEVKPGDVFFLPAGRVHAIGAGCFIAEIQQTSDITYRIYDYNRKDAQGKLRELHTELAKDAIDYTIHPDCKPEDHPAQGLIRNLVDCNYFTTDLLEGNKNDTTSVIQDGSSFSIFIALEGKAKITDANDYTVDIRQGETVLVPAENTKKMKTAFMENGKILRIYIKNG
jgi:mannose-6-phosphate isomerase